MLGNMTPLGTTCLGRIIAVLTLGFEVVAALSSPNYLAKLQTENPTLDQFIRRAGCRVAVLGDYVYIDGGEISQIRNGTAVTNGPTASSPVNETQSISLKVPWTNTTAQIITIPKKSPKTNLGVLWSFPSLNVLYAWGGSIPYNESPPGDTLWKFTPNGSGSGTWEPERPTDASIQRRITPSSFAQSNDTGYVLGGAVFDDSGTTFKDPEYQHGGISLSTPGLVSFNVSTLNWKNDSTTAFSSPFGTYVDGALDFAPAFGSNGILVPLGGYKPPLTPYESSIPVGFIEFSNISIYDIATGKWYWQTASGTIPTPRRGLCSVSAQESNTGRHEIFIFGGRNDDKNATYDEVFVLSLPGFFWSQAQYTSQAPRANQACAMIGNRQMLSVGGYRKNLPYPNYWTDPDPWPMGLGIFDLSKMKWSSSYDPNAPPYAQPQVVKDWYRNGGSAAWSSDAVKNLFVPTSHSTGDIPSNTTTLGETAASHTGAIAGGVVGGVAGLLVVAFAIYIFLRKHKKQAQNREQKEPNSERQGRWTLQGPAELHDSKAVPELPCPQTTNELAVPDHVSPVEILVIRKI